jgi:hypothetical protein
MWRQTADFCSRTGVVAATRRSKRWLLRRPSAPERCLRHQVTSIETSLLASRHLVAALGALARAEGESAKRAEIVTAHKLRGEDARDLGESTTRRRYRRDDGDARPYGSRGSSG